jgi:hypothetical protein
MGKGTLKTVGQNVTEGQYAATEVKNAIIYGDNRA